ncbi:MAG: FHA domain-containing protein [Pyrinomonadaceae bacterium]
MYKQSKFNIIREDLLLDPVTIISEGLLIGRLQQCELLLNHPTVSRTQAGLKEIDGNFYLFNLRASNPVKLNGKPIDKNEALAPGDVLEIGPFIINVEETDQALTLRVSFMIGLEAEKRDVSSASLLTIRLSGLLKSVDPQQQKKPRPAPRAAPLTGAKALDIFWDKRIREAGKMVRPSPLFPRSSRRSGKAQFNWMPTTDLRSHASASLFFWGAILVGLLSVAAALWHASAFAPAQLSRAHAKEQRDMAPSIAQRASANSCTNCHSITTSMETNCSNCHQTDAFVATITEPHEDAAIGCTACHTEHRGADFYPKDAAFLTCAVCHNDKNKKLYNGKSVGTAHGGTFGYPVVDGVWKWKGLDREEWATKQIALARLPSDTDDKWRSKQFHTIHLYRVRPVEGIQGNKEGEMSCSSCHKSFTPVDRETPRTTCAVCHNGQDKAFTQRAVIAADQPNCVSCHVQHIKDKRHWNPTLMKPKGEVNFGEQNDADRFLPQ